MSFKEQIDLYFDTLHCSSQKGGRFIFTPQDNYNYIYNASVTGCKYQINKKFEKYNNQSIFCTLNSYKGRYINNATRSEKDLWGIDCVMIDIDGDEYLCGHEKELFDNLKWYWEVKQILPKPNLYSFTGGGGIHLYYTFDRLPKTMSKSVKRLKYSLCDTIKIISEDEKCFPVVVDDNNTEHTYHVDYKIVDNQRYDRVPGSVNPKTGNICECFATGQARYKYRDLTKFFEDEEPEYQTLQTQIVNTKMPFMPRLLAKRINSLFKLAEIGKTFEGCRESALFILFNSAYQLQMNINTISKLLFDLNNKFPEPLSTKEVQNVLKSKKLYKFTNKSISNMLNLTKDEENIMFSKKRPGNRKERTYNNKVNIAKLVYQGFSCSQIAAKLSLSLSCVKHMRTAIKKEGGFVFWALDCNIKKFKEYVRNHVMKLRDFSLSTSGSFCNVFNNLCKGRIKETKSTYNLKLYNSINNNAINIINNNLSNNLSNNLKVIIYSKYIINSKLNILKLSNNHKLLDLSA